MQQEALEKLKYPIGRYVQPQTYDAEHREKWINAIRAFPSDLTSEMSMLPEELWNQTYRPGGWTLRQVVHHIADSHLNAYTRFKWALTEEEPVIKDYNEDLWVNTPEVSHTPPSVSLQLIESIHKRWIYVCESLEETHWGRKFYHPVDHRELILGRYLSLYAWHGEHHLNHIRMVRLNTK